jgi:hypothetical protein
MSVASADAIEDRRDRRLNKTIDEGFRMKLTLPSVNKRLDTMDVMQDDDLKMFCVSSFSRFLFPIIAAQQILDQFPSRKRSFKFIAH